MEDMEERTKQTPGTGNLIGRLLFRILIVLAAAALLVYLIGCLSTYFTGFSIIFSAVYGWQAVLESLFIIGLLFWYIWLACLLILVAGAIYFRKTREKYDPKIEWAFFKRVLSLIWKPILIVLLLLILYGAARSTLLDTYWGAKIQTKLGLSLSYQIQTLDRCFGDYDIDLIEKNDELIYVGHYSSDWQMPEFLNDLYYADSCQDLSEKLRFEDSDHYALYDEDGIYICVFLVKDDIVEYYFSDYDLYNQMPVTVYRRLEER